MDLARRIYHQWVRPAVDRYETWRYGPAPDLHETQWWPLEKLRAFQDERLRHIVRYAYEHIPAYRRSFDAAGVSPADIRTVEDLPKLPIVTREQIQTDPASFTNRRRVKSTLYTGGSTGVSLRYYECAEGRRMRLAAHHRGWSWMGYMPGQQRLAVVGSAQGIVGGGQVLNLNGKLDEANLAETVRALVAFRPEHLRGYVSSFFIVAWYLLNHEIALDSVRSINVISENLYDYQRDVIERAFGAKVFEEYVCNDGGAGAWECERHTDLHYCMERAIIESVDGEAIVTDLWNHAMPFIRYRNGDAVQFTDGVCECGRPLPLLRVRGRANDVVITPNGPVSPSFITHTAYGLPTIGAAGESIVYDFTGRIDALQFVQTPGFQLTVNVVSDLADGDPVYRRFQDVVRAIFPGMTVAFQRVAELPATPKGKRQFIVNHDTELLQRQGFR